MYFGLAALLAVVSCVQEESAGLREDEPAFAVVGDPVNVRLKIAVDRLCFGVATRAEEPVPDYDGEDSEDERHVDDLWLLEYSSVSGELIYPPQRVVISRQEQLSDLEVTLSNNYGKPVTVYVVVNSGSGVAENSAGWVVAQTVGSGISYPGFMTIGELEANTLPTPHPQRMTWDEATEDYVLDGQDAGAVSIPMSGQVEATVRKGTDILVPVSRMFAKLLVRVDLSDFNEDEYNYAWLNSVTVGNIPEYCTVKALATSTTVTPADYSACPRWLRREFNSIGESSREPGIGTGSGDNALYPYLIYVPENIQGENVNTEGEGKGDNVPNSYALSVSAGVYVETLNGAAMGEYTSFVAYPGGNSIDNFNVRRNCLYRVTLKINDLIDNILPSANCIVCLSGETTAFFPYCREETGGGYNFTDYLDAEDGTGAKRIDHVGIIWQSTDGGNTVGYSSSATGYIGDNSNNDYVWIDNVEDVSDEYHRRIHVRIPSGKTGNALIGAYNSSNEVIWSWHIWSREAENDPRIVNTKLYYTYDWDNDGIYGKDSGRPRVAGYTIMNCNLGAMRDEPSGSIHATSGRNNGTAGFANAAPTFGTLYQWGRKDPFPPITTLLAEDSYGGNNTVITDYNTGSVGNYFDNSNKAVTIVGTNTSSALFHSVPGSERKEFDEMVPLTIHNPTVFYAGTKQVNQKSTSYVGGSSSDSQSILSNNYPSPHDGNWILDDSSEHFNRLWGGYDPEHDQDLITKTYYTGLTCLLGDIHMYDDYGEKSIFDPCPYGWRVSPPDLWLGFTDTGLNPDDGMNNVNYLDDDTVSNYSGITMYMTAWKEGATSFFPIQGTRAPDGCAFRAGQCGNYNNATADAGDRVNILHIHYSSRLFKIFENGIVSYFLKSTASPARCVRIDSVQN